MIYTYSLEGLPIQTGDIICTTDMVLEIEAGEYWRLLGRLLPGEIDRNYLGTLFCKTFSLI